MALPGIPTIELFENSNLTMLRYIYDVLTGGGGGGAVALGVGTYNKPVATRKTNSGVYTVVAGTAHSVLILAQTQDATYNVGGSVNVTVLAGTTVLLEASTLFSVDIVVTAGAAGTVYVTEMQPQ